MSGRPTFEDLAGGDPRAWTRARVWAEVDPNVAETVRQVQDGYAALGTLLADTSPDDPRRPLLEATDQHGWPAYRTAGSATMNALIRRVR